MSESHRFRAPAALVGDELTVTRDVVVAVEGGSIASIEDAHDDAAQASGEPTTLAGVLLIPGFIDAHVHMRFAEPSDVLHDGVTTVRDLGAPPDEVFALSAASRADTFDGPSVLAVGPIVTAPGGYPSRAAWAAPGTALEVDDPARAEAAVGALAERGAVAIKIALNPPVGPTLDDATLRSIVDAARGHGLTVTAHIHGMSELSRAIDAGVGELAHMLMSAERIGDDVLNRMIQCRVVVVPTLSIFNGHALDVAIENLARFLDRGGRVVYGTDLGNEGPRPGIDPLEVTRMARAGMSTVDIVRAATVDAAAHLGSQGTGRLARGYAADLVGVPLDALEDPKRLAEVRFVTRRGRIVRAS